VLLAPQDSGGYAAQYLKPQHVESVTMPRPMFVFLTACQVGAGQRVLGDYAGLATAFLSAGAAGVVAALWNVKDLAARDVAVNFYRTWTPMPCRSRRCCGDSGAIHQAIRGQRRSWPGDAAGLPALRPPRLRLSTIRNGDTG